MTPYMVLLAGLAVVLAHWSGRVDIAIGSPVDGRSRVELEDLIGFFVNTVVLRLDLSGDPSVRDLLDRVRETTLEAQSYSELPFERLVEELAPDRSRAHTPLVQVMFVLQNSSHDLLALPGLEVGLAPVETGTSKFDMTLHAVLDESQIAFTLIGATDLFDAQTLDRFSTELVAVLQQFATPQTRLSALDTTEAVADDPALARLLDRIIGEHDAQV